MACLFLSFRVVIRRKRRKEFDRFLDHKNPRVRELAQELLAGDIRSRAAAEPSGAVKCG